MMENNLKTQAPPPSYNGQAEVPGQTYYQPPPPPEEGYKPPPPTNNMGQRFTQFYAPPQNRSLGLKRRFCSAICCCIIIGLIIGLASGLTSGSRNYGNGYGNYGGGYGGGNGVGSGGGNNCNCQTNADCIRSFGSGTYCYSSCQCARR